MDAHARVHAQEIAQRFASGHATNGQILVFGLTGGSIFQSRYEPEGPCSCELLPGVLILLKPEV
jgi:ABC-type nickel/cobalt efflux system permease component RcnA